MPETKASVEGVQRACNRFTKKYLRGITPLIVDGDKGRATNRRIMGCKYYLGYGQRRDAKITRAFLNRMEHPRSSRFSPRSLWMRGSRRRVAQRARWAQQHVAATVSPGVTRFDGVPCAKWLAPYLTWARKNGWQGRLVSGWRSPAYSESLCYRMCNRPSCPGKCAGKASNHSGSAKPRGAVDVSDYGRFFQLMPRCPYQPRIFNALGARDPVHGSANGR